MLIEFIEKEGPKWNINDTPDYDVLYVVYNNKILEKVHCYNKYNLGYQRCVMVATVDRDAGTITVSGFAPTNSLKHDSILQIIYLNLK